MPRKKQDLERTPVMPAEFLPLSHPTLAPRPPEGPGWIHEIKYDGWRMARSPNGRLSAILFERSCGATTGRSAQVSVLTSDVRPAAAGNTFVADANHGAAQESEGGGPWVEVAWIDDKNLIVRYDAQARVFTEQPDVAGVMVTYQPIER